MLNLLIKDFKLMGFKIIWLGLALTAIIVTVSLLTSHEFVKLITMPILFMLIGFQAVFHHTEINQYQFIENSLPVAKTQLVLKNYILMFLLWGIGTLLALALNFFQELVHFAYVETNILETVINSFWLNNFFFAVVLLHYTAYGKYRQALYMAMFCIFVAISMMTVNEKYYNEITSDSLNFAITYLMTALGIAILASLLLILIKKEKRQSLKNQISKLLKIGIVIFSLISGYAVIMNFTNLWYIKSLQRALDYKIAKNSLETTAQIANFYQNSTYLIVLFCASALLLLFHWRKKMLVITTELKIIILLYFAMFGYIITMRITNLQSTLWTMSLYTILLAIPMAVNFHKNREF